MSQNNLGQKILSKRAYLALLAAFVAVFAMIAAVPAEAGRGHGKGWKGGGGRYVQNNYYGRRSSSGFNALGAGLIGLGVGAVIGSALTPREVYVTPPPRPAYRRAGYRPVAWSEEWFEYCYARYRSFNPRTGTFIGYDGYERFCR